MIEEDNEFYLWKTDEDWCSAAVFWGEDNNGYVTDISKARVFTKEQAQRKYNDRPIFVPVAKECVDERIIHKVDCQYISASTSGDTHYLAVKANYWDGNDLFFKTEEGGLTTDIYQAKSYGQATVLNQISTMGFYLIGKKDALSTARPTVTKSKLNRRKMTTPYGIIKPKPYRNAKPGNKSNCGNCGRFITGEEAYRQQYADVIDCEHCEE